ncbi:hypothetical protein P8452_30709 [Trifolium repens]|nr:hypothetical protein P8452_30709 [Trifolium repens]
MQETGLASGLSVVRYSLCAVRRPVFGEDLEASNAGAMRNPRVPSGNPHPSKAWVQDFILRRSLISNKNSQLHWLLSTLQVNRSNCLAGLSYTFMKFLYPNNGNRSSNLLSGPMQDPDVQIHESMDRTPKDFEHPGCPHLSVSELNLANSVVEPKTSIEFPVVLDNLLDGEQNYSFNSEVMGACLLYLVVKFLQPLMTLSLLSLATVTLLRRF